MAACFSIAFRKMGIRVSQFKIILIPIRLGSWESFDNNFLLNKPCSSTVRWWVLARLPVSLQCSGLTISDASDWLCSNTPRRLHCCACASTAQQSCPACMRCFIKRNSSVTASGLSKRAKVNLVATINNSPWASINAGGSFCLVCWQYWPLLRLFD